MLNNSGSNGQSDIDAIQNNNLATQKGTLESLVNRSDAIPDISDVTDRLSIELPDFDSSLPSVLHLTIPKFEWQGTGSAGEVLDIEIHTDNIQTILSIIRACFRFVWYGLCGFVLLYVLRWLLRLVLLVVRFVARAKIQ